MKINRKHYLLSLWLSMVPLFGMAQHTTFQARCAEGAQSQGLAVQALDGWCFLKSELRFLSVGEFWGECAQQTSLAANSKQRDPLQAIVNYKKALDEAGIALILAPIPPKAVVYPDKLDKRLAAKRYDVYLQTFYQQLKQQGVNVLDLTPSLLQARASVSEPLYCLGDSHLSGEGCRIVAETIAQAIKARGKSSYKVTKETVSVRGDLYKALDKKPERRTVYTVSGSKTQDAKAASVVLMGDSHTLVFDVGGGLFAEKAGIASLLAASLKMPIDVVGVRGSGATPARINLYRKSKQDAAYLQNKKTVVWCFAAREFTEASGWNASVPVR